MMSRVLVVVMVVVVTRVVCLPSSSLALHHSLELPYEHPPAPVLHPSPASDGADSEQLPPPVNEENLEGEVISATQATEGTRPPGPGRTKRGMYDYGTPWERRVYGRRQTQNRRGRLHRQRSHRYPYDRRRQHHNYRGPDYGDFYHETSHKYNNAGYVDTSRIDSSSKTVSFAHAKASGVLRTSTTGGTE